MGCVRSKNTVFPGRNKNSRVQRDSGNITHGNSLSSSPRAEAYADHGPSDGRKSVAYNISLDGKKLDSLIRNYPPKKSQRFAPSKYSHLSAVDLIKKQRLADLKREQVLQRKQDIAHKTSERGEHAQRIKQEKSEAYQRYTNEQIENQMVSAERIRESKLRERTEKQKQREDRGKQVRQQRLEPLNDNRLSADILFETDKNYEAKTEKRKVVILEKMFKSRKRTVKSSRTEEQLSPTKDEGLRKAEKNRENRKRGIILKQKWREIRAKEVRRKAQILKEPDEFDIGEIEADDSYFNTDENDFWSMSFSTRQENPTGFDDFFDLPLA